jgi:hypothetical protein
MSALPWSASKSSLWSAETGDNKDCGWACIEDATGEVVAIAVVSPIRSLNDPRDAERRDTILRAVNAHDDLVAALRLAGIFLKLLADEYDADVEDFTFCDTKVRPLGQVQLQIAAALAKAGEL